MVLLSDIGGCLYVYGEFGNAKIFIRYAKEEREHNTHAYVKYSGSSTETNSYLSFISLIMLKS